MALRSKNQLGGKAKTVGVLVDSLGDPYQATICDGIQQGATHAGANLLIFVGGALPAQASAGAPRHAVFGLAGPHTLDGLVVLASTMSHEVGAAGVQAYCTQFAGLPLCSVGMALPGIPSVTIDNEAGMRAVVRHAIEQHTAKRIAFISGPAANPESELRVGAYRSELEQHALPFDERLLLQGAFTNESGEVAIRTLVKRLGPQLANVDAIIAANDNMAIGAMHELARMTGTVREGLAVLGFDDIQEARLMQPSLTTSRQPLERLGLEAVRRILQLQSQTPEALDVLFSTELVVRHSCGCSSRTAKNVSLVAAPSKRRFELAFMGQREPILAQLSRAARGRFAAAGRDWEQLLLGAFVDDLVAGMEERFLPTIGRLIERLGAVHMDLNVVDDIVSCLRDNVLPLLQHEPERQRHADDLFHAARLFTSATLQRSLGRAHLELTRWARTIGAVCNAIAACVDLPELRVQLRENLQQAGMRSCFVIVYEAPGDSTRARLVSSHPAVPGNDLESQVFNGRDLVPQALSEHHDAARCFAVLPLLGSKSLLGHVLFGYTAQHVFACGLLADAISIALRHFLDEGPA